jgi:hypothetical protein
MPAVSPHRLTRYAPLAIGPEGPEPAFERADHQSGGGAGRTPAIDEADRAVGAREPHQSWTRDPATGAQGGGRPDHLSRSDRVWAAWLLVLFCGIAVIAALVEATHGLIVAPVVVLAVVLGPGRKWARRSPGRPGDRS